MKKTWTKRILIALMTLAIVGSVFGVAPRAAQAAVMAIAINQTNPSELTMSAQTLDLSVTVTSDAGDPTPLIHWQSSNEGAVSVQSTGNTTARATVGALGYGSSTITASVDGNAAVFDTIVISVTPSVTVSPSSASVEYEKTTQLSATTFPSGREVTWASDDSTLVSVSSSGLVTGSGVTASAVMVSAKMNLGGMDYTGVSQISVTKIASVITPPSDFSIEKSKTTTLSATSNNGTDDISWSATSGSFNPATTKSGGTTTYTAPATGTSVTITLNQTGTGNYSNAASKTVNVRVTAADAGLWANTAKTSAEYGSNGFALTAGTYNNTSSNDGDFNWTWISGNSAGTLSATTGKNITFTPATTGTGSVTAKLRVTYTNTSYETATKDVEFVIAPVFNVSSSTATVKVGSTTSDITASTTSGTLTFAARNGTGSITIAQVSDTTTGGVHTMTYRITGTASGTAYLDISNGVTTKTVTVTVQGAYPVISTSFNANTIGGVNLSKVYSWGQLTIRVKDYNPAVPYVTVTRSNIRTYMLGGSYYTHPSTYTYTVYLTQEGSDGVASPSVVAQYNGSTYYTVSYSGAATVNSTTIYVTGFTTLPQTGPDYTWAYVLGGLCLITVATAVTLNVRKKKRESI